MGIGSPPVAIDLTAKKTGPKKNRRAGETIQDFQSSMTGT